MKDRALEIVASRPPAADGTNLLREYLQSRVLRHMQEAGAFVPLAFMGGTALRFLYRIPRFSVDLDFTVERDREAFDLRELVDRLERELVREGYSVSSKLNEEPVVARAMVGFPGILEEARLSPHGDQTLWLRVEVDTNPTAGAGLEVSTIDRFGLLRLQHHDMSSLFAGKLAAVLAREHTKGRDLYDLMWYLTRDTPPEPNIELLRNALLQTVPELAGPAEGDWRTSLRSRLAELDWDDARADVAPFLEQPTDVELIGADTFEQLLRGGAGDFGR